MLSPFINSNLNRTNLKTACETMAIKKLVPTRVGGTRWVPHTLRALNNLWTIYPALVLHLSQVGAPEGPKTSQSHYYWYGIELMVIAWWLLVGGDW